jgi:hypothetical protein
MAVSGLADGSYRLVSVDAAGNVSAPSGNVLTVDNQAPLAALGITSVIDNVDPNQGPVVNDGGTNDNTLALSGILVGSLAVGEVVKVYDGSVLLGQAAVADDGQTWTFLTPALANGDHSFTARVVDAAGNLGPASGSHSVTVAADVPGGSVLIGAATAPARGMWWRFTTAAACWARSQQRPTGLSMYPLRSAKVCTRSPLCCKTQAATRARPVQPIPC